MTDDMAATQDTCAAALFLLAATQPTDRALRGWNLDPGWFAEELASLGITYGTTHTQQDGGGNAT